MPNNDKPIESQTTKKEAISGFVALNNATNVSTNKSTNSTLNASLNLSSKQNTTLKENETSKNITSKNRTKIERNINKTKESTPNKGLKTGLFSLTISNYVLALILLASIILGVSSMILLRAFKSKQKEMSKKVKSSKN
jgi:16S rRNA U1498 N3-methylase RsmE